MNLLEMRGPHRFGPWTVTQLVEWEGEAFPHTSLFPDVPIETLRQASPAGKGRRLTGNDMIITSTQLFLLQKDDLVVLIELGSGNDKTRPIESHWDHQKLPYLETLAALDVRPEQVAFAFISHCHLDHVGLGTSWQDGRWVPTFPKARYILGRKEWDYWGSASQGDPNWHPCLDDSVRPLVEAGCIQWVEDGDSVAGLHIHEAAGHTPGNLIFELEGQNLWFLGDLLHHPAQVAHPEWPSSWYDWNPEINTHTRRSYFKCFADAQATLFGEHTGNQFKIVEGTPDQFFANYD